MSEELKPCPFCGGDAVLEDHRLQWVVACCECESTVVGDIAPEPEHDMGDDYWSFYEGSAVMKWNLRAILNG